VSAVDLSNVGGEFPGGRTLSIPQQRIMELRQVLNAGGRRNAEAQTLEIIGPAGSADGIISSDGGGFTPGSQPAKATVLGKS
jgi:hypothetical protein